MLRNHLAAAFGNLTRNGPYAGITILGLAVAFAAAILVFLFIRDELSYDHWLPDHQRTYRLEMTLAQPGDKPLEINATVSTAAGLLKLDFPEVEQVGRVASLMADIRRGRTRDFQSVTWTDPQFFSVLRLPALAGDPRTALRSPDAVVITHSAARKYFGEDAPIGRTLEIHVSDEDLGLMGLSNPKGVGGWRPMRVAAVLQDLPSNTHFDGDIFAAGQAPFSILRAIDQHPSPFIITVYAYVRLKPGASVEEVRQGLRAFADRHYPGSPGRAVGRSDKTFHLTPIADIHFLRRQGWNLRPPGDRTADMEIAAVGVLIVVIAALNFVTLTTARATRRGVEVGIRKAVGARRSDLIIQFLSEALLQVLLAMLVAGSIAELSLPYLNAFLRRTIRLDYLRDGQLAAAMAATVLLTGLLAGLYPALILSGFRPAQALKGGLTASADAETVRRGLVVAQFAVLIGLAISAATIYRQTVFALHDGLRVNTARMLWFEAPCNPTFRQEVDALPGVKGAACASTFAMDLGLADTYATLPGGRRQTVQESPVDPEFFELHGLRPLAGRFFSRDHGDDVVLEDPSHAPDARPDVVLNETAVHRLGFSSSEAAVGKTIVWSRSLSSDKQPPTPLPYEVIGVVPDFTLGSIRYPIEPEVYFVDPSRSLVTVIKLRGREIPETIDRIQAVWRRMGHEQPLHFSFEDGLIDNIYHDVVIQGQVIGACAGLAILIAALGLFALAAFTTERRTKEIGVRKAMGASTVDVMRLLLWQFTKPVLWANLIAWPLAFWAMDRWLHGFAYRVDLPPWLFLAASAAAVLIAWATVCAHAWLVARERPVAALRYE